LYWFDLPTLTLHLLKDGTFVSAIFSSQPEWIVASEKGLDRFQPGTQQISPIESAAMGKVNDVAELCAGRLLIAGDQRYVSLAIGTAEATIRRRKTI